MYRPKMNYGQNGGKKSGSTFNKYAPPGFRTNSQNSNSGNLGGLNKLNNFLKH